MIAIDFNNRHKGKDIKRNTISDILKNSTRILECRAPLHKRCPKHQGHKGDPGVTPGTCCADGEKAQLILVWVRAPGVGNASHPRRLGIMRKKPRTMRSSWREDFRMLKNTSFGGVS
jgi:hypothetical protein